MDPALISRTARRSIGRPKRRWDDDVQECINNQGICISWQRCAMQHDMWNAVDGGFATQRPH
eukprot:2881904-Pyramimonas_sp.AAC.1